MAGVSRNRNEDPSLDFKGFLNGLNDWDEKVPDATSEKELGNEYFKQKKYCEAIECYSRSIGLSPTAVAYANRAMAYIKVKRFEEAENDCTEALNLDDRYVKAYSRRATARKELGKFEASMQDSEFAMRLEPNTPELRKQYTEARTLFEKPPVEMEQLVEMVEYFCVEIAKKNSGALKNPSEGMKRADISKIATEGVQSSHLVSSNAPKGGNGKVQSKPLIAVHDANVKSMNGSSSHGMETMSSTNSSVKIHQDVSHRKKDLGESVQDLASRAASRVTAAAVKNISTPKSAYEFEVSWRALSGDSERQAHLLKTLVPATLPQIFKNALSAPMLIEIIKCTATFFKEDTDIAVSYLVNLAKVPRFDMIVMCLSAVDHAEIHQLWDQVFSSTDVRADHVETLRRLRPKYCYGDWQAHGFGSSSWPY